MSIKTKRIASNLEKEITYIIYNEVDDKDIKFVSINYVELASDLSIAKVYWTTLMDDKKDMVSKALDKASSYIRGMLFDRVELRHIPKLEFIYDDSINYGNKIEKIIKEIHEDEN